MNEKNGFTLIELLIVISIIGIIMALSIFGLQNARESSRDGKRKADIEQIRSSIEIYRSDCNHYPTGLLGDNLVGDNGTTGCSDSNVYINSMPTDPLSPTADYYYSSDGTTYELCAYLENGTGSVTCGGISACGSKTCNYKTVSP